MVIINQVGINTSFLDLGFNNLRKVPNLALRKLVKAMMVKIMMMMMMMMMKGIFTSYGISYLQRLTYIRPLPTGVSEPSGSKVGTSHSSTPQLPRDPI